MIQLKYINIVCVFIFCMAITGIAQSFELNAEEQDWLKQHPIITIAYNNNFPPYGWKNNEGSYQGISIDYLKLIENQLNIKFTQIKQDDWSKVLTEFKAGNIDILAAVAKNNTRQKFMLFTKPYISVQGVIVSIKEYKKLSALNGEKVGVVNDSYWDDLISQYDKDIQIVRVNNTQTGIELVSIGAIDAMVSDLASVSYIVQKESVSHLKFVPVPVLKNKKIELSIGIKKDWPLLKSILEKAINNINQNEIKKIHNKWLKVQEVSFWQDTQFQYNMLFLFLIISTIIALILFWNHSLKMQVLRRSEELDKARVQLIHAEKMESIGRLSAGVAHEVKNPLAILQMSVDYLKGEDNSEIISTVLDDMDDAIARADKVIKSLLDFSREKELQMTQASINNVITKSLRLIEHELKQHNIKLTIALSDTLPDIKMDTNRLQQVFINLLMNAIQAMASGKNNSSEIIVSSTIGKMDSTALLDAGKKEFIVNQKVIIIKILDTGHGLDEKNKQNVFEPFYTTKPVGEGTGLGLSVSKTIIGLHHGMITMKNRNDTKANDQKCKGVEVAIYFAINGEEYQ